MTARFDPNALAHRALATATLYSLAPRGRRPTVAWTRGRQVDLVVAVDAPPLDEKAFTELRDATATEGIVAVLVASTSAAGLLAHGPRLPGSTEDWARHAATAPLAPAVSPPRLRAIAAAAASVGLVLVEPDQPRLRLQTKGPVDRAVLATVLHGATARALLFVKEAQAPKAGLIRLREDRMLDGWMTGGRPTPASSLFEAALGVLAEAQAPLRGKDLLREARVRWGQRASSNDGPLLAKALASAWVEGTVELFAADPVERLVPEGPR